MTAPDKENTDTTYEMSDPFGSREVNKPLIKSLVAIDYGGTTNSRTTTESSHQHGSNYNSGSREELANITPSNKCKYATNNTISNRGSVSYNPLSNESPALQLLFGWGIQSSETPLRKIAYSPIDSGYEADEGELPDYVYDKIGEENTMNHTTVIGKISNWGASTLSQVEGYEFLNTGFLDNLGYNMKAVMSYIGGLNIGDKGLVEVAREFFHRKRDVDLLLSKIEDLEVELASMNSEFKSFLTIENELNLLRIENGRLKHQVPELNSMIMRVKARSSRQRKRISGYTYHSQSKIARKKKGIKVGTIPIDLTEHDEDVDERNFLNTLKHIKDENGASGEVWKGSISGDPVIVKESEMLLKGGDVVDTVVNGWGEIVNEKNSDVIIMNAGCHGFISHVMKNNESARLYIDPVIENFRTCRKMIFPINPNGRHWTLLEFDLNEHKWTHYNSMLPADIMEDQYLKAAKVVKDYVENKIEEIIARDKCGTQFEKTGAIKAVLDTPQQTYGTVDCGIFVCILIERLVKGKNPTAPITPADVATYRKKMVRTFVERGARQS